MTPWKAAGAIAAGVTALSLCSCDRTSTHDGESRPVESAEERPRATSLPPLLKVAEFQCTASPGGMAIVQGTVTNAGETDIRHAKLRARLLDKSGELVGYAEGYIDAAPLPRSASSPFKLLGPSLQYDSCQIDAATSVGEIVHIL